MSETTPTDETVDRRQVEQIPTAELIQILGAKLLHHPMHLSDSEELKAKVAEIAPPPESPEPAPFHRVGIVISELRQRTSRLALHGGFEDLGVSDDTLLQWSNDLYQVALKLTVIGGKHALSLMEMYAEIESTRGQRSVMKALESSLGLKKKE